VHRRSFTTLFGGAVILLPFDGRARLVGNLAIIKLLSSAQAKLARRWATWP
jgi:hypothetical protein